jgi:hypothetical protein
MSELINQWWDDDPEYGVEIGEINEYLGEDLQDLGLPLGIHFHQDHHLTIVYSDCGNGNVETVALWIQLILRFYGITGAVAFDWAETCNKPRLDGFSGGAIVITRDDMDYIHTEEWISKKLNELGAAA